MPVEEDEEGEGERGRKGGREGGREKEIEVKTLRKGKENS